MGSKRSHRRFGRSRFHLEAEPLGKPASSRRRHHLIGVPVPCDLEQWNIPDEVARRIETARLRIQAFQDRWDRPQIEQFVSSDFEHVYRVLRWIVERQMMTGNRMLEWGCGFAVVSALAASLGLDVSGIEAEQRLLDEAQQTLRDFEVPVELVRGNFLPPGAESLARNPDFPSLGHDVPDGYTQMDSDLDDFALVFGYPWPGEWVFHEEVFLRYAAPGALLVLFCGPNDIRVHRKSE